MSVQAFPRATTQGARLFQVSHMWQEAHSTRLLCGHRLLAVLQALAVLVVSFALDSGHAPDLEGSLG